MKRLHVHVAVDDLSKSIRFYSTLFAAEPSVLKGDYAKWMLEDPRVNFAISARGAKPGIEHLGIQVEDEAGLTEVYGRLARAEAPVLDEGATTCCYAQSEKSWITDPAGVPWEVFRTFGESTVYGDGGEAKGGRLAATATAPQVDALVTRLRAAAGVDDVIYDREVLRRVLLTVTTVRRVVTTLAALLALAAFAAVAAVLRLGYYARRDEIEVLGLVGAPPRAISGPFVAEGLLQAAAGTVVALVLLRAAVWLVGRGPASAWTGALELPDVPFLTWKHMLTLSMVTLLAGALAGWVGSREISR